MFNIFSGTQIVITATYASCMYIIYKILKLIRYVITDNITFPTSILKQFIDIQFKTNKNITYNITVLHV